MNEGPNYPDARATIIDGQLTLVDWDPRLKRTAFLTGRKAQHAEVRWVGEPDPREALVMNEVPGALDESAKAIFIRWGAQVGLDRIWFQDDFADLRDEQATDLAARVRCSTCQAEIAACGIGFWEGVRSTGMFPSRCSSCGGCLPQWETIDPSSLRSES